ncbi:hypothetical protein JXJ21_08865 [candidate division KSB1 bacterium]|nr:hypothetical protein [candidate division KSB1 bacterium]
MLTWGIIGGILIIFIGFAIWFFERKQPAQLVLIERKGEVSVWKRAFYPKPLCLVLPATVRSVATEVKTQAKGKIDAAVKLVVTFYADPENIAHLIRIGGWSKEAPGKVEKELAGTLQGIVGEIVEPLEITEITRETIAKKVKARLDTISQNFGIQITAVTVTSAEALEPKIVEAIRQREEARILEETEKSVQTSRIARAEMKASADQKIAEAEHHTAMKNYSLRKIQEEEAAILAKAAVAQQTERRQMELEIEKHEVEILAQNPSLLLLAPQLTRLTEASQQLKNAETVITLSSDLLNKLPAPIQQILSAMKTDSKANEAEE